VLALRKVNILAAAQTAWHAGASRTVGVIEQPVFAREFLPLFHFTVGLERKLAFLSRWRVPGSIAVGLRGAWVRAILACAAVCRPEWEFALNLQAPPSSVHVVGGRRPLRAYGEMRAHIAPGELSAAAPTAFHPRRPTHGEPDGVALACSSQLTGYQMRAPFSLCPKRPAGSSHVDRGGRRPKVKRGRPQGPRGAGRFGHFVKCAHPARRGPGAAAPAAQHSPPGGCPRLAFELPSVPVLGTCRPLRAYGEVRAYCAR
jgi:hypothetical protein